MEYCSNLDRDQQATFLELLVNYSDVFATNPKSPNTTHVDHHVINTNGQLPIKEENIRVSPNRTKNFTGQAQDPFVRKYTNRDSKAALIPIKL